MNFENKIILITGASSGIGKELAVQLASKNCKLIISARREDKLEELKQSLTKYNSEILTIKCDVSDKDQVARVYDRIIEKFGKIDIAILNSGVGIREEILKYDSRNAELTMGVNFFGVIYWIEKLLPGFIQREGGMIVGVSSLADNRGYSKSGFYCASKAALSIYLDGLRLELKKFGIKVLTVKPGFVRSEMTDQNEFKMPMLMETDKAARIILKGIEKEKRVIQFPRLMVFLSRLLGIIPRSIYDRIGEKY